MRLSPFWETLKDAGSRASKDKVAKLSASLAYYTVFSLPALLLVITVIATYFLRDQNVEEKLFSDLGVMIGYDVADNLKQTIDHTQVTGNSSFATIAGIAMLVIGATGMFSEMQDSLNKIFGVTPNPKLGIRSLILSRVTSFGLVVSLGFLLLVSLLFSTLLSAFTKSLKELFPDITIYLVMIIDFLVSLGFVVLVFASIFKVLPDIKIAWKDVFKGALFTAVLFMLGKIGISIYLGTSSFSTAYGAAGSIIILLVWVYYSSILLYIGAEFTRSLAVKYGEGIKPNDFSNWMECRDDKTSGTTT